MCKFYFKNCLLIAGLLLCLLPVFAQQLKLGVNPSGINKSAVLELESTKQGLLLTRVSDTTAAPLNTAPDGMLIYFTVDKTLLIRKGGFWRRLIDITTVTAAPVFYNGGAVVSNNVKIWADTVLNNVSPGTPTANYAAAGFTKIMSITATAVGGSDFSNAPIVSIRSYNLTSVNFILLQNHHTDLVIGLLGVEGLQLHTTTTTKVLFTVIGY